MRSSVRHGRCSNGSSMRALLLGRLGPALVPAFVGLGLGLVACSDEAAEEGAGTEAPAAPAAEEPKPAEAVASPLVTTSCRFLVPRSVEGKTVRCADLEVPENRRKDGSRTIRLHVAIVQGNAGGAPTIELNGGPGGGADHIVGGLVAREPKLLAGYAELLAQGDLVFFDQRGTGRSVPRLSCSEMSDDCAGPLLAAGVDLAAYDTQENAADVRELALALGKERGLTQVNLHGISYGTRLGIEVAKRYPEVVRAMILDGVMPPDVQLVGGFPMATDRVLTRVFDSCAKDAKCNETYPDLEGTLSKVAKRLTDTPLQVKHPLYGPLTYDWSAFLDEMGQRLYAEGEAGELPRRLHELLVKDGPTMTKELLEEEKRFAEEAEATGPVDPLQAELFERLEGMTEEDYEASGIAQGMYLSVTCNDYFQHETVEAARAVLRGVRPELVRPGEESFELAACQAWPLRPSDPITRQPARWDGPALLVGGLLDPATPSAWAEHASMTLAKDTLVLVPDGAHGLVDACGAKMKGAFLGAPDAAVDATCATSRTLTFSYATNTGTAVAGGRTVKTALRPASLHAGSWALAALGAKATPARRLEHRVLAGLEATAPGSRLSLARAKFAARARGGAPTVR